MGLGVGFVDEAISSCVCFDSCAHAYLYQTTPTFHVALWTQMPKSTHPHFHSPTRRDMKKPGCGMFATGVGSVA